MPAQPPIPPPDDFSRHTLYIDVRFPHKKNSELSWSGAKEVPPWPPDTSMANGFRCVFLVRDSLFRGSCEGIQETSSRANMKAQKFQHRRMGGGGEISSFRRYDMRAHSQWTGAERTGPLFGFR